MTERRATWGHRRRTDEAETRHEKQTERRSARITQTSREKRTELDI